MRWVKSSSVANSALRVTAVWFACGCSHVVRPRAPLKQEPELDYTVDSADEWEEVRTAQTTRTLTLQTTGARIGRRHELRSRILSQTQPKPWGIRVVP